jgi:hypothetical protein
MAEKYFLMPGVTISKDGLPGKKLECKKGGKPLELKKEYVEIIKKNLPFLMSQKKVVTSDDVETVSDKEESGKSEKRIALEKEAIELGVEFNSKTSGKDLEAAILEKKTAPETGDDE